MDQKAQHIQLLERQPWEEIMLSLDHYALCKTRRLYWPTGSSQTNLAKGFSPQDIVRQAIVKLFEGERKWDPESQPDLLHYLKGVVDSLISSLVTSGEVRTVRSAIPYDENPSPDQKESTSRPLPGGGLHQASPSPAANAQVSELLEQVRAAVIGDEDLEMLVLCFELDLAKPKEIAKELGITPAEVTNRKKRLKRVLDQAMLERLGKIQ